MILEGPWGCWLYSECQQRGIMDYNFLFARIELNILAQQTVGEYKRTRSGWTRVLGWTDRDIK